MSPVDNSGPKPSADLDPIITTPPTDGPDPVTRLIDDLATRLWLVGRGNPAFAQEFGLVYTQGLQGGADRRDTAFADPHRADIRRFDQGDLRTAGAFSECTGQVGGGHPAGRTAAGNQNAR